MLDFLTQSTWADRIGWMLVHSLWQFALVAVLAVALRWTLYRCAAVTRYRTLLAAMCIMVALPVVTWYSTWPADAPSAAVALAPVEPLEETPRLQHSYSSLPQHRESVSAELAVPTQSPREHMVAVEQEPPTVEPAPAGTASPFSLIERQVQSWLPEIVLIWFAGVLVAALRPLLSWYTVGRLRAVGVSPVGDAVHAVVKRTAAKLGFARSIEVLQSTLVKAPVVVGYFCPAILLPLSVLTGLPESQLELILAHELAHIRRHDYLVNLFQTLFETLFFYHPGVWWLSRAIRNERENCCDDVAMAVLGSRADYGRALLAVEQLRASSTTLSLAASGGSLVNRIRRIAGCEPAPRLAGGGSILCILLISLAVFVGATWGTAPATANPEQPVATPAPAPATPVAETPVPAAAAPAPATPAALQRILRFDFRFQLWTDVLEWFAEEADLLLVMNNPPPGTFNYSDARQYSPKEAIDVLNSVLLTRGFTLIRRDKTLIVQDLSQGIPDGLVPLIEVTDLDNHGDFELVTVRIPLGRRDATSVLAEITAVKGAHNEFVPLTTTRQLLITDMARNVRTMAALIEAIPEPKPPRQPATANPQQPVADTAADAATAAEDEAPADGDWEPGQTLDVQVIHAQTKEPLPGVKLEFQYHGPGIDFQEITTKTTDAEGRSQGRLPDLRPDAVRIYPSKAGFVPLRVYWGDDLPSPKLPKAVTIPMQPGTVWGGVVQNENGEPIANVKVNVRYWEKRSEFNPHLRVNIADIEGVTTDKDGRWRMDILPAKFSDERPRLSLTHPDYVSDHLQRGHIPMLPAKFSDEGPRLFLTHPDYVSDHLRRGHTPMPVTERPSYETLRAQTAVMVMRKGGTIEGRVIDETGRPVSGVRIHTKEPYWSDSGKPVATTGEDGRFRIANLSFKHSALNDPPPSTSRSIEQREIAITVHAEGYTPELVHADPNGSTSPLEVTLKPGQSVAGQITDESGKPVEGVSVSASNWLGYRTRLNLRTETDADGEFRLADAPSSDVLYNVHKNGYMVIEDFSMSPQPTEPSGDEGYQITLRPPVRIVGSIVDAETNKPLAKCWLMLGGYAKQLGSPGKAITDGRYEIVLNREQWLTQIRVEADGYKPAVSRHFKPYDPDRGLVTYDFRMTKAVPTEAVAMAGTVLGLDEQPLPGAEVFLATHQFFVENGAVSPEARRTSQMVKTDAQGRFEFPPEAEPFYLIALHEQGHIVLDEKQFAKTPTVRIEPWPSAKRTLMLQRNQRSHGGSAPGNDQRTLNVRIVDAEGNPVEGANVASSAQFHAGYNYLGDNESAWQSFGNAISDQYGRARVPDLHNCVVARHVERKLVAIQRISPGQFRSSEIVTITMEPQCKVFGRLTATELEARNGKIQWSYVCASMENRRVRPMNCNSNRAAFHFYLPPGTYQLEAYATDTQHARKTITVMKTVTVNPGQQELEVDSIDLPPTGLVLLEGKPAPELREVVAWKNGGPVKLSDLKGKVVVLAFSSHWVADRPHEWMPNLFTICDKYGDQGLALVHIRLGPMPIIGIDSQVKLDERIAEVKSPFWEDRDLPIPIALGLWNRPPFLRNEEEKKANEYLPCAILKDYGVNALNSLPTGVLIDRQGRIVGEFDLRSDGDNAVLEKLLKEK